MLTLVFACNSPYISKFSGEFSHPEMDPKLAAIISPDLSDMVEYGTVKLLCPDKTLKSLDHAVSSIIESKFFKKLTGEFGPLKNLEVVLKTLPSLLTNSLSEDALGYKGTRQSMRAAIGAAYSSDYDCPGLEKAAELYYHYDYPTYVSELCSGKSTLKTVLSLLKPGEKTSLEAMPLNQELKPYFIDIFDHDESLAQKIMNRKIGRIEALNILVDRLSNLPLCHQSTGKYVDMLRNLASLDSPLFFPLYDEIVSFKTNCPINFSGFYLEKIQGDVLYFSNGNETYPFLKITPSKDSLVERHPDAPLKINISGVAPISTEDEYFDTSIIPEDEKTKLNIGRFSIIALFVVLSIGLWIRAKKT